MSVSDLLPDLFEKMCVVVVVAYLVTRSRCVAEIPDRGFNFRNLVFLIAVFGEP